MAAATAAQIAELRRMCAEPTTTTYSDVALAAYIERYPLTDARGQEPFTWDVSTVPPSHVDNTAWVQTYDLHAAAADVWNEKAAALAHLYDFSADGGSYSRSQGVAQAQAQARYHLARRNLNTIRLTMADGPAVGSSFVINWPEPQT